jgi:transcriptional regulator GlxA family with amidase domain
VAVLSRLRRHVPVHPDNPASDGRDKVITAAGVSSGIDMALRLVQLVAGDDIAQAIQLSIEYVPQPSFDAGSPQKAPAPIVQLVR